MDSFGLDLEWVERKEWVEELASLLLLVRATWENL